MDSRFNGYLETMNSFNFIDQTLLPSSDQYQNPFCGFDYVNDYSGDFSFVSNPSLLSGYEPANYAQSWSTSPGRDSLSEDGDFLKYISHILNEEDIGEKASMFHDSLALQATEKSLCLALDGKNPGSPSQPSFSTHSLYDDFIGSVSESGSNSATYHNPCALQAIEKSLYQDLNGVRPSSPVQSPFSTQSPFGNFIGSSILCQDAAAFQATEKSFHQELGGKQPSYPNRHHFSAESPDSFTGSNSDYGGNGSFSTSRRSSVDLLPQGDLGEYRQNIFPFAQPVNSVFQCNPLSKFQSKLNSASSFNNAGNGLAESSVSDILVSNIFSDSESILQFKRGMEEASKFLPKGIGLLDSNTYSPNLKANDQQVAIKEERNEFSPNGHRAKHNHGRDDTDLEEERSSKLSAVFFDESELSELFDRVLLCHPVEGSKVPSNKDLQNGASCGGKSGFQKQENKSDLLDLNTLLIRCAQAVSAEDIRSANDLLKQVKQHASPFGDGSQRLAHYFSECLKARLAGTGSQIYTSMAPKKTSAADMLKAYQVYVSACPFNRLAIIFANHMILEYTQTAKEIHIIDFGILYGFQWPALIHCLARRPGGPPKLRITGIELPQKGFRPAEKVEETGRRLAKCCERFKVPFEYNAVACKWENIRIEDIKINRNETVAVNCLFRFKNLLDETVVINSPRNSILRLIRRLNPSIFVHAIVNGSYSAPFFVTRFREALFHYSALFDMLDTTLPREDQMRLMYEREFYGQEAVNAVACEDTERVERPETCKQWQVRTTRAGFKQLPLDPKLMEKLKRKLDEGYHHDFVLDKDGNWMLQGWKGRTVYASSSWVPA